MQKKTPGASAANGTDNKTEQNQNGGGFLAQAMRWNRLGSHRKFKRGSRRGAERGRIETGSLNASALLRETSILEPGILEAGRERVCRIGC